MTTQEQNMVPGQPIAIVGMACVFPGADSVSAFWKLQLDGVDATGDLPGDRFSVDEYYDPRPRTPGRIVSRRGGFLPDIRGFDAHYFGISGREASHMDPQQRLLLQTAATAVQDAGLTPRQLVGSPSAVIVGQRTVDYWDVLRAAGALDIYANTGTARSVLSGRLSYFFDLRGPSTSVDTACSSSLVAVHQACGALRSGEATLALAAGVNLVLTPEESITFSQADMLSADGRCKFGAHNADGFVRSDGVGAVVLKPLAQAEADGDHIYAVIHGSAVENEGRSSGYLMTPSETGQIDTMRHACLRAGVDPRDVGFVEAHGTGTSTGDPIELRSLDAVYGTGAGRPVAEPLLVGSVKTNIGHTEAAAGIAAVIKTALCVAHGVVPPSLHSGRLTDAVDWDRTALEIPQTAREWGRDGKPRYAAISSFGISGTNAHVVLGEHRPAPVPPPPAEPRPYLLTLSAQTPAALRELAEAYADHLGPDGQGRRDELRDISFSTLTRSTHHRHRMTVLALEHDQAAQQLRKGRPIVAARPGTGWKTVFVFPGQGSQWAGMGRQLLRTSTVFRETIEECDRHVRAERGWSVIDELNSDDVAVRPIDVVQPLLWAVEVGLAALWQSWGVTPEVVIGHSMGEVAAACTAGALTLADGAAVICRRSALLRGIAGTGSMAAVDLPADDLRRELADVPDVDVAVSNGPRRTIISGRTQAVEKVLAGLAEREVFAKTVKVDVASHSSQVDSLLAALRTELASVRPRKGQVPLRSTVTGELLTGEELDAGYWVRNLRDEVLFHAAVDAEIAGSAAAAFVEISPHPILGAAVKECFPDRRTGDQVVPSLLRDTDDLTVMLTSVGQLHQAGYPIRPAALFDEPAAYVRLPAYPWQRTDFWPEPATATATAASGPVTAGAGRGGHPLLGAHVALDDGAHRWEGPVDLERNAYLLDHQVQGQVILPGTAYVELAVAAAAETIGTDVSVGGIRYDKALFFTADAPPLLRVTLRPAGRRWTFEVATADGTDWTGHAHGVVEEAPAGVRILDGPEESARQITDRVPEHLTGAEFYRRFAARGNDWYGVFQGIRQVWRGDDEALSEVVVPAGLDGHEQYHVHPAVLDACGQVLAATLPDSAVPGEQHAFILGFIDAFRLHAPLTGTLHNHVVQRDLTAESFSGDITVRDDRGVLLAEFRGLRIRWLLRQEQPGRLTDWLYRTHWTPAAAPAAPPRPDAGAWLVFEDEEFGPRLAPAHGARIAVRPGDRYERTGDGGYRIDPSRLDDYARLLHEAGRDHPDGIGAVVHLWGMRAPRPAARVPLGLGSALLLCQALSAMRSDRPNPRLVLVTRGAETVTAADPAPDPDQYAVWGFGRTAASELSAFRHTLVDLDAGHDTAQVRALAHEIAVADPAEDQIALRAGDRYVLRLRRPAAAPRADDVIEIVPAGDRATAPAHQVVPARPLADDEVRIAAAYGGVTFRDVLQAAGAAPDPDEDGRLGRETAGVVTATGAGVRGLQVGDRVVALARPGLATEVLANRHLTHRLPDGLGLADAATVPVAYLTAWYGLMELAALREGEKVLIHSATGGVGLAAIQVARRQGAEIYATAGSEKRRAILRTMGVTHVADSRGDFAGPLLDATRGAGMDVILNSLTGTAVDQNLSMLAPYGRYVELAGQDPADGHPTGPAGLPRNGSFHLLDVAALCRDHQERAGALLGRVLRLIAAGELAPLPAEVYPIQDAGSAFGDMIAARHIGKVLIDLRTTRASAPPAEPTRMRPDATYLVTGGAGGLGSELARWLVARGARHLLLTGRSVPDPDAPSWQDSAALLDELRGRGVEVQYAPVDASDEQSMRRLIEYRRTAGRPPVRGVFHTAGVFWYKAIGETTLRDLDTVLRPKLEGGRVLDRLFDDDLDHFVLFSSGNALLASPQVAAAAAANAGLDAIARGRRRRGRAALSVNWGFWTGKGMAAKAGAELGRSLIPRGMTGFTPTAGLAVLDHLLATDAGDTVVMPVDWEQWQAAYPVAAASPLLREVVDGTPVGRDAAAPVGGAVAPGGSAAPVRSAAAVSRTAPDRLDLTSRWEPSGPVRRPEPSASGAAGVTGASRGARVPGPQVSPAVSAAPEVPTGTRPESKPETRPAEPVADPEELFLAKVAAILRVGSDHLDPDRDLTSQGLDSLMAAQLRQEVQRSHGVLLPIGKILSRTTLSELSAQLGGEEGTG
ncbi:SDR family NAD(P)-dependent oxidoreductase [Streptomyces sp. SL13]|uniref:SDR family NAD(P)-dependent oxidoreductase n=1 Tax=Streptantibioticus silvisoli TaxID=2705255 RepID=A0AA90H0A1_9ACTN|nr:type I polyketide synthase [Streptantibioticus silvisoli]MDI5968539.1 SDR family NAD(P)-dependent oxidoreductase [Streptantibioticus silvisoli]